MQKPASKQIFRALLPYVILAAVTLLTALVLFSNLLTRPDATAHPFVPLTPDSWSYDESAPTPPDETTGFIPRESVVTLHFTTDKIPAKTLTLHFASDSAVPMLLTGSVSMQDVAFAPGYRHAASFAATPGGTHRTVTVPLVSADGVTGIDVTLQGTADAYVFLAAQLNAPQRLHLAWGKWLVLFLAAALAYTVRARRWYAIEYDFKSKRHAALLAGTLVLCLCFAAAIGVMGGSNLGYGKPYPGGEFDVTHDQYEMQLDAWQHGRLALTEQPAAALLALDNPYSIEARNASGARWLYDTVLYDGQYYSYYGIAPLLCVYYPFYWLTGSLPTGITVCTALVLLAILGIYGAVHELLRAFHVRPNLVLYLLGAPAAVCGSMLYFNQSCLLVYYVPLLCALAFLAWFVCFAYRAVRAQGAALRAVRFVLAALCLALCVAARPNVAVFCVAFAAPLFLSVLFDKQRPLGRRAVDAASFAVPAFLLCMAVLWYNYARFGSLFEFGSTYNLTNNDIRFNTLSFTPARLWDMLYNCFLLPFQTGATFPFVSLGAGSVADYGRWYYNAPCTFGVFAMPLAWFACLAPKTLRRTQPVKSASYLFVWITALCIAYVNCCVGGLIERYTCDILLPLLLIALPILLEVFGRGGTVRAGGWLYSAACLACCASILFGVLTVFAPHPDLGTYVSDYAPDAYLTAQQWFALG